MIAALRDSFNANFKPGDHSRLIHELDSRSGAKVGFRVAETPVFLPKELLDGMAATGARLAERLLAWPDYLAQAKSSIPKGFRVEGDSAHPNFLTADFALVESSGDSFQGLVWHDGSQKFLNGLTPRLVEIQAFPSVYAYQAMLNLTYAEVFGLSDSLGVFLSGLTESTYWDLLGETILAGHDPENVVLTEVDPLHQKTLPDFVLTNKRLGIPIVDIAALVPVGKKLHYRNSAGLLVPIHRIYNRAIADEMMARKVNLPFRLTDAWDVEWAGHPSWYFLISKFSVPWLCTPTGGAPIEDASVVPPAAFLEDFLSGAGKDSLMRQGVELPQSDAESTVYENLLLKPLFSFAGKGIQFAPSRGELMAIPQEERANYLLQQRMHFVPTVRTPHGMTQAEIRILYLWPDGGKLTPAISLVRLGRGKMMGVDHNRNQEWVGASAGFWG